MVRDGLFSLRILKVSIMVISQLWKEKDGEMGKDQGPKQSFLILL